MTIFKSIWIREKCPRCGGNLYIEREEYGRPAIKCLMCARTINPDDVILTTMHEPVERVERT
jgi:hypothetical protein